MLGCKQCGFSMFIGQPWDHVPNIPHNCPICGYKWLSNRDILNPEWKNKGKSSDSLSKAKMDEETC